MSGEFYDYTSIPERKKTRDQWRKEMELTIKLSQEKVEWRKMMNERDLIPEDWRSIERDYPCTPRGKKITVRVDEDVVKFFAAMGTGWHARVNGVLRTYMLARLSKLIEGDGDEDWLGRPL